VGQSRWRQLSPEEQQRLSSAERWRSSLDQLLAAFLGLVEGSGRVLGGLGAWIAERRRTPVVTKRWVRPESPTPSAEAVEPQAASAAVGAETDDTVEVASFGEVDELLRNADRAGDAETEEEAEKADEAGEKG
jgi:isoleucyl-tRNA synthetase